MVDVLKPEIPFRVIAKEAPAGAPTVKLLVDKLRVDFTDKGAEDVAKSLSLRQPDKTIADHRVNENIGLDRDPAGTKINLTPVEQGRLDRATNESKLLNDYLTNGFDKLTPAQQTLVVDKVIDRYKQTPVWNKILTGMSPVKREAFVKRIVSEPGFREKVMRGNETAFTTELTDSVSALNNEVAVLEKQLTEIVGLTGVGGKKGTLTEVEERIDKIKNEITEYQVEVADSAAPGGVRTGKNYARISESLTEMAGIKEDISPIEIEIDAKETTVRGLKRELEKGSARDKDEVINELKKEQQELMKQKSELVAKQVEMQQKTDLYQKLKAGEAELKTELTEKDGKKSELDAQRMEIEGKLSTKRVELSKSRATRSHEEETFVKQIEDVMANAADGWMDEKVQEAVTAGNALLEKQATEQTDQKKQAFTKAISERYFTGNKVNVAVVKGDYQNLLSTGPDALTQSMLVSAGYTPTEITAIMGDATKMAEFRGQVTENVLKMYMLRGGWLKSGGRISADEVMKISTATWGHEMIENAVKGRTDMINAINKASGDSVLTTGGKVTEKFRKHPVRNSIMALMAIAGLLGGGIFGAGKI